MHMHDIICIFNKLLVCLHKNDELLNITPTNNGFVYKHAVSYNMKCMVLTQCYTTINMQYYNHKYVVARRISCNIALRPIMCVVLMRLWLYCTNKQ